jgi:hypothetical protein
MLYHLRLLPGEVIRNLRSWGKQPKPSDADPRALTLDKNVPQKLDDCKTFLAFYNAASNPALRSHIHY